jgi:hypothetical protein
VAPHRFRADPDRFRVGRRYRSGDAGRVGLAPAGGAALGGGDMTQAANDALTASATLSGSAANITAAQFTFRGLTFLAINQVGAGFQDATDLLLQITGATGTIDAADFIT